MIKLIILSVVLIGLAIAGIAVKLLVSKEGEFKKSCSSVDPKTGQRLGCSCGGEEEGSSCRNKEFE
jgi:hypothetical protein